MENAVFHETSCPEIAEMCVTDHGEDTSDENKSVTLNSECECDSTNTSVAKYKCGMETFSSILIIYYSDSMY